MSRIMSVLLCVLPLAIAGAPGAVAQVNCQPTITQPCAKPQAKPNTDQSAQRPTSARADDRNEPIDYSKRIPLNKDTDFNYGLGGFGLKQKF
jgi:hypothetical protein